MRSAVEWGGRALCAIVVWCLMAGNLIGAPFAEWIEAKSPKGAVVRIWGQGDEYSARFEAVDGHAAVYDRRIGAYAYARKDAVSGALVTTGIALGDETPADLAVLAGMPLHERDVSEAFSAERKKRIDADESNAETRRRWQDLKTRQRQRRRDMRAIGKGEEALEKAPPSSPTVGKIVGVTLLIDFPTASDGSGSLAQEVHPNVTKADLEQLVNGENFNKWGNASSVRKYYAEVSGGNLVYTNVVLGWFKAAHPRSYYDDSNRSDGECARPLIGEILGQIANSPEFSSKHLPLLQQASYSGSYFKALNVFFAGSKSPVWNMGLWAHKWTLGAAYRSNLAVRIGTATKYFDTYQISPVTENPGIGTFCHENGHMICDFPDLYSYEDGGGKGVGAFCLMSSPGAYSPQCICAYLRVAAGWVTPREMPTGRNVLSVSSRLDDVWSYSNPVDDSQYFLIENRQRKGRDSYLPGGGVLIWRCDENGSNTYSSFLSGFSGMARYRRDYELSLEQADGLYELEREENGGGATDCWYRENPVSKSGLVFSDTTMPCAKWKDGSSSGLVISGFSANDDVMTFHVGEVVTPSYTIDYSLGGGSFGSSHPSQAMQGDVFCVSAPTRGNDAFLGWSVLGLDNPSAKWGTSSNPGTTIASAATRCKNGTFGNVYFKDLAAKDGAHVTLIANWRPVSDPTETGNWHVAAGWGSDANSGTSWSAPFATLQKAVDVATSSARAIVVYDGQYEPFASAKNVYLDIRSVNGAERTIVDGSLQWARGVTNRCAKFYSNGQTMTGFTLLNGRSPNGYGGGSYSGILSNCIYRCNSAYGGGGAYGGTQHGCHFHDNTADYGGGGYNGVQYGCLFDGNVAKQAGGGSYSGVLYGCLLHDNVATWGGGCYMGTLQNCTVGLNWAANYGGGVQKSQLYNCIVWGNMSNTGSNVYDSDCNYTCSTPQETGAGNMDGDPKFVDAEHGDFRLMADSPCINAGANRYVDQDKDLDGNPRISGGTVDMGAYEWRVGAPARPVNDDFANATAIGGASGSLTASSVNATKETGEPYHGILSATNSVWWKWTAPARGSMTMTTEGSGFDTGLGVYTGSSVSALTKVASNDDVQLVTWWSSVTFPTVAGTTYYIAVAGYSGATGAVKLNWSFTETVTIPLSTALDNTGLAFMTGGDAGWFGQNATKHDGTDAARSGAITDSQSSWMQTSVTGPGTISFWWYVSSESVLWDYLSFSIDGMQVGKIGGTSGSWAQCSHTLGAGNHVLKWIYRKDGSGSSGLDAGFVDQVVWTPAKTFYVSADGSDNQLGLFESEALATIQRAVDLAQDGDEIIVLDGRYEPIETANKAITIRSANGAAKTFIDGALQWSRGLTNRCARLGTTSSCTNSLMIGFTLTNGRGYGGGGVSYGRLRDCRIVDNVATNGGGAFYSVLENCEFSGNVAVSSGGGAYCGTQSNCTFDANLAHWGGGTYGGTQMRCRFEGNRAEGSGGGSYDGTNSVCRFVGNRAQWGGGLIYGKSERSLLAENHADSSGGGAYDGNLSNCLIIDNDANWGGGSYTGRLSNCTLSRNTASYGGGAYKGNLYNCIAWGNSGSSGKDVSLASCAYTCSGQALSGAGNISADPLFVDAAGDDFRIVVTSPCRDAGANAYSAGIVDYDGNSRIIGGAVDMGAFECVRIPGPPNDDFERAAVLSGMAGNVVATNTYATYERGEPLTDEWSWATNTVWWVWTAPSNGIVQVDTIGTSIDTELGVYIGSSLATLKLVEANDDCGDGLQTSACVFECEAGTRYYFVAAGGWHGAKGTVRLNWRFLPSTAPFVRSGGGRYGLFIGVNRYVLHGCRTLSCCEVDVEEMSAAGTRYGGWMADSCHCLLNEAATKANVRAQLASLADVARPGDTVLLYQSSHGGQKTSISREVSLCMYDKEYWDYELAEDLARFKSGVKLVVVVDACHSGGLFKDKAMAAESFDLAARVLEIMRGRKLVETKGSGGIDPGEIGWISAADYDQTSQGDSAGSEFTMAMVDAWTDDGGAADLDGDRRLDFYDLFKAAEFVGAKHGAVGQCANESVLKAVTARLYSGYAQTIVVEVPGGKSVSIPGAWFTSGEIDGRTRFNSVRFAQLFGTDYAAAAKMPTGKVDARGNPMYVWQDFIAGTDPTDKTSGFKASIGFVGGKPVISWTPDLNEGGTKSLRVYRTFGIDDLSRSADPAAWREVAPGSESAYKFFKVEVDMK